MTVQNVQVHTRKATKDSSFRLSLVRHMLRCCVVVSSFFYVTISWVYSEVIHPRHYEGNIVVGVIAAKEVTYIEEWLAHHFYYGVDKIVVFDDNKPEDILEKAEMKRICESFGDRCEIMDFNQYDNVACLFTSSYLCSSSFLPSISGNGTSFGALAPTRRQGMAMKELYYHDDNYQKYRWVMMFDVDEFMVTKDENTTIPQVLSMLPPEVHAVHVPRLNFGTSNHDTRPEGSVRNNYCWAEKNIKNSKGMARPNEIMLPGISNHYYATRSMMSSDAMGGIPKFVHVTDADKDTRNSVLELADGSRGVLQLNHFYIDPSVLVLNHYFTKSKEEFQARRSRQSLNYLFKLTDVYKDDKTAVEKYSQQVCDNQRLSYLPPLMTTDDLYRAENERHHRERERSHNGDVVTVSTLSKERYLRRSNKLFP